MLVTCGHDMSDPAMGMLTGRTALVTGASHGIGAGIARELARAGAHVAVSYRSNKTGAQSVVSEICADGGSAVAFWADLDGQDTVTRLIDEVTGELGPIDILINNAGSNVKASLSDTTFNHFQQLLTCNVTVPFLLLREVADRLRQRETHQGCVINISSIRGQTVQHSRSAYCASKAALDMITRCAALELGPYGIRVNGIAPGLTATGMNADVAATDPRAWNDRISRIPLRCAASENEYGKMAVFLASDAARWITGAVLVADGGHTLVNF